MELALVLAAAGREHEVRVTLDEAATVAELAAGLARRAGVATLPDLYVERTGQRLHPDGAVLDVDLRPGDRVRTDPPAAPPRAPRLVVSSGWHAGSNREIAPSLVVGRDPGCEVQIADGLLSRRHFQVAAAAGGVTVEDLGSANGTFVDGRQVTSREAVGVHALLEAGRTVFRVAGPAPASSRGGLGPVEPPRPPRVRRAAAPAVTRLDVDVPRRAGRARLPVVTTALPVAGAIVLAFFYGPRMLGFALLAPLLALGTWYEERRRERAEADAEQGRYGDRLAKARAALDAAVVEELRDRRTDHPDLATLADRATAAQGLWDRRPVDDDFLVVRLGLGDVPARSTVTLPDQPDAAEQAAAELGLPRRLPSAPVTVGLPAAGVLGVAGPREESGALASALLLDACSRQAPGDLAVLVALDAPRAGEWGWARWLPHARTDLLDEELPAVAFGQAAPALLEAAARLVAARAALPDGNAGRRHPSVLLVTTPRLAGGRAALSTLLDATRAGVHVVVLADDESQLPQQCAAVATVTAEAAGRLTWPATGVQVDDLVPDLPAPATRTALARILAGYRDAGAGAQSRLPAELPLLVALGLDVDELADQLALRWRAPAPGLAFRLGVGPDGAAGFDLRADGPHALVGGTTGAGKSELLQTLVASLAASYSPERVTFLLVDYKGGAAFKDCLDLPHVVGLVTDLDGGLVHRALISLNAELRRREHLLRAHGCKDSTELERRAPRDAPPSLIVVVDEFAALARELPEFVDGIVDVAQRGRSLGLHLVLATQRPAGTINDNVRANTNLRIALRMNDRADSEDVLGTPDAARLSRSQPGRAYVRTGDGEVQPVQVAFAGGRSVATSARVEVVDLDAPRRPTSAAGAEGPSDLARLVAAAQGAARSENLPPPRRPWLPALPELVDLGELDCEHGVPIGRLDVPSEQRQDVACLDLDREGGLLVLGGAGSGKTSVLRTVAVSLATRHAPAELHLFGLDFASGALSGLAALPHCGGVVTGGDQERTATLFALLERELRGRADRLAQAGAANLAQYERSSGERLPRLVLLLDGYPAFQAQYDKVDAGALVERFPRLVADGRAVGIVVLVTADRRTGLPLQLVTALERRVVLEMPDRDEYVQLGVDARTLPASLPPGRGWLDGVPIQVALAGVDQREALESVATELAAKHGERVPLVGSLPDSVPRQQAGSSLGDLRPVVGVGELDQEPVAVDLSEAHLLVAGPARSGRSTTLATLARNLAETLPGAQLHLLAPRRSPLTALGIWTSSAKGEDACADLAGELEASLSTRDGDSPPVVVVVDDANDLRDTYADSRLELLARRGRDLGVRVLAATDNVAAHRTYGGVVSEVRRDRHAVLLRPDVDLDGELAGVRLPRRSLRWPAGRAYVVADGSVQLVQVVSG